LRSKALPIIQSKHNDMNKKKGHRKASDLSSALQNLKSKGNAGRERRKGGGATSGIIQ